MTATHDPPVAPRSLSSRTVAGLGWSYLAAGGNALIQIGYVAAMSRLLDPAAFGLMAVANIAVSFGFYIARMGVAQALIQRKAITDEEVRAAFTSGWVVGTACAALLWAVAPLVAGAFGEPAAAPLLRVLGLTFIASGLSMTSQALLRRGMRFRELSAIQVQSAALGAGVGLVSALLGNGVWSLVHAALASTTAQVLLQHRRTRHPLRPLLELRVMRELYGFGVRISIVRMGEFAGKNLDTIAVGRAVAAASLGVYNRAFHLVNLPVSQYLSGALSSVLFPGFSRLQGDPARLRRVQLSVLRLGSTALLPLCAGMAVAGPELVLVAMGPQWVDAIPLVAPFAVAAAINILSKLCELVAESQAALREVLILQYGYLLVLVALLIGAAVLDRGLVPFAVALATGEVLRHGAYLLLVRRLTGVGIGRSLGAYLPALFAAVLVSGAVAAVRGLADAMAPATLLALEVVAAAAALLIGIRTSPWRSVRRDLRARAGGAEPLVMRRLLGVLVGGRGPARAGEVDR